MLPNYVKFKNKIKFKKKRNQRGNKTYETNENENTTIQNIQDTAKVVLRGKFISIQFYLWREEISQVKKLQLKQLQKEEQTKFRVRQKERNHKDQSRSE